MSANAPAGKVSRKKGNEAALDKSESSKGDADSVFITQVAAMSCAETQHPETTLASHRVRKVRLRSAVQIEVVLIALADRGVKHRWVKAWNPHHAGSWELDPSPG
jgi:hypothetical protein